MRTQLFTVFSVLVGALASYLAASRAEQKRFERSLSTRWDDRTLTAYVDYISSVKALFRHGRRGLRLRDQGEDPAPSLAALEEEEHHRSVLFEAVLLLGSEGTRQTAHRVNKEIWRINALAREQSTGEADLDEGPLFALLSEFGDCAREHLQVNPGRASRHEISRG